MQPLESPKLVIDYNGDLVDAKIYRRLALLD